MFLLQFILVIISIYPLSVIIVFFLLLNNPFKYRNINYTIPFGITNGTQIKKSLLKPMVRYWVCKNSQIEMENNWVILFHSWGRNSQRMTSRAQIYWDLGYSLIFLDARSHGQTSWSKTSKAVDFFNDARRIVEIENIENPIIHGLSFGSVASSFYAYRYNTKAVILEALPSNFKYMFSDFLATLKFPKLLYGWIPSIIMKWDFPWEEYSPENTLSKVKSPIFLIHGEKDEMFSLERHFNINKNVLMGNSKNQFWIVPNSSHSKMAMNVDYKQKLLTFVETLS